MNKRDRKVQRKNQIDTLEENNQGYNIGFLLILSLKKLKMRNVQYCTYEKHGLWDGAILGAEGLPNTYVHTSGIQDIWYIFRMSITRFVSNHIC